MQNQVVASSLVTTHQLQEQGARYIPEIGSLKENVAELTKEREEYSSLLKESRGVCQNATRQLKEVTADRDTQAAALTDLTKVAENEKTFLTSWPSSIRKSMKTTDHLLQSLKSSIKRKKGRLEDALEEQTEKVSETCSALSRQQPVNLNRDGLVHRLMEVQNELEESRLSHKTEKEELNRVNALDKEKTEADHQDQLKGLREENLILVETHGSLE